MDKNLQKTMKNFGLKGSLTLMDSIIRLLHALPALIKDGHIISFGEPGTGKTTLIEKSSKACTNIPSFSNAILFGNQKTMDKGIISDEYDVAYYEQTSRLSNIEGEIMTNLLTHCSGNDVRRIEESYKNRTSLVFLGNCNTKYIPSLNNLYPKFNDNFFEDFPDELKERQGLERIIILPTFLMEKITLEHIISANEKTIEIERRDPINFEFDEEIPVRLAKEKCKIITTLNYFLNDDKELDTKSCKFKGFEAIADSIVNLKNGEYKPFYYKNENGRKIALALILNYLPENSTIEEAHFLEHRALIKLKEETVWYKIALDRIGKLENIFEKKYFQEHTPQFIPEILTLSADEIILKQRYVPLASNYFSIKEFDYLLAEKNDLAAEVSLLKIQQEKDRQKIAELTYALGKAIERINDLVLFTKGNKENINLTLLVNPNIDSFDVENSKKDFCKLYPNIKLDDLKNKNIGITNEQQIQLVNFAPIFYTKK